MTTEQKPEAGEVIEWIGENGMRCRLLCQMGGLEPVAISERGLAAAGFVAMTANQNHWHKKTLELTASLAAAKSRVAELEAQHESAQTQWREVAREQQEKRIALIEQLASERAGRERLKRALVLLVEECRNTHGHAMSGESSLAWRISGAEDVLRADDASTPAPSAEGPASPVAEGETPEQRAEAYKESWSRGERDRLRERLHVAETEGEIRRLALLDANDKLRAQAAEGAELLEFVRRNYRLVFDALHSHKPAQLGERLHVAADMKRLLEWGSQPTPTGEAKDSSPSGGALREDVQCNRHAEGAAVSVSSGEVSKDREAPLQPDGAGPITCDRCGAFICICGRVNPSGSPVVAPAADGEAASAQAQEFLNRSEGRHRAFAAVARTEPPPATAAEGERCLKLVYDTGFAARACSRILGHDGACNSRWQPPEHVPLDLSVKEQGKHPPASELCAARYNEETTCQLPAHHPGQHFVDKGAVDISWGGPPASPPASDADGEKRFAVGQRVRIVRGWTGPRSVAEVRINAIVTKSGDTLTVGDGRFEWCVNAENCELLETAPPQPPTEALTVTAFLDALDVALSHGFPDARSTLKTLSEELAKGSWR